jgi:fused signal recognition particle receptor
MGFFKNIFSSSKKESLDKGLEKSKSSFFSKLNKIIVGKSKIDNDFLDDLEEILISSDVGVNTTLKIIERIELRAAKDKYTGLNELNLLLKEEISLLLSENESQTSNDFEIPNSENPYVIMVVGVNGVGNYNNW